MNCRCARPNNTETPCWIKLVWVSRTETGEDIFTYVSDQVWRDGRAEVLTTACLDNIWADCNDCRHKLRCLINDRIDRTFESKQ